MATPTAAVSAFVDAFIGAWPTRDATSLGRFFAADAVYVNGPLEPVHGRGPICDMLAAFMMLGGDVDVQIRHVVSEGQLVMTERVDYLTVDGKTSALPVMGVVEFVDGLITAWRDYFDLASFTAQGGEGL